MKFSTNTKSLSAALNTVSKSISAKSNILPALEGVLLSAKDGTLTVTGYNLEIGITTDIPANVSKDGSVVLAYNVFNNIVKKAPKEEISLETDERLVTTVKSGNATFDIVGIKADDYPDLPEFDTLQSVKLKAEVLCDAISATSYACSTNMNKPIYTGSLFELNGENLTVVAIDGIRMALKKLKVENNAEVTSVVIPLYTQKEIQRLFTNDEDVEVLLGQRHATFKNNNVTIISRLIEGTFIDYNPLISTDTATTTCIVDVNRIRDAEQRCSVLDNSVTLLLNFDNEIELKTNSSTGRVAETITPLECQIDGEPVMIGFNPVLLDSTLNALSKRGNIKISMTGSNNPAIVTADGDDTEIHLIVPMRISK